MRLLHIKGAREHNLKDIDLDIPLNRIVVITGPSGSGKTTLALDCIYAESRHRYLDSLGLSNSLEPDQMLERPRLDSIENIPPAIAVSYEGLIRPSPRSNASSITGIAQDIRLLFASCGRINCPKCGHIITVLSLDQIIAKVSGLPEGTKFIIVAPIEIKDSDIREKIKSLMASGFTRLRVNSQIISMEEALATKDLSSPGLVIDRLIVKSGIEKRLSESIRLALSQGERTVKILVLSGTETTELEYCETQQCPKCKLTFPQMSPSLFSPWTQLGMCNKCRGNGDKDCECEGTGLNRFARAVTLWGVNIGTIMQLTFEQLYCLLGSFLSETSDNKSDDNITLSDLDTHIEGLKLQQFPEPIKVAGVICSDIYKKLRPIISMGLGYIKLNQRHSELSAGELRRLHLSSAVGKSLTGVLYIIDEPSVGLHPSELSSITKQLVTLRDQGNSLIIIEHNIEIINKADYLIDMGPGAGKDGGEIIVAGSPEEIGDKQESPTSRYLGSKYKDIKIRTPKRPEDFLKIQGIHMPYGQQYNIYIPMNALTCISGVSGSGKSSLLKQIREKLTSITENSYGKSVSPICMDQTDLGKNPVSMPVTYIKAYDYLRKLFARIPEARQRGLTASSFSLSKKGGRCERCKGKGHLSIDLKYLPSIRLKCDVCQGKRFSKEVLSVKYHGLSIADCLDLSVSEAIDIFNRIPPIRDKLMILNSIGLGYLKLGQSASSLSTGESQRMRLARELTKSQGKSHIYLLDEPFRGLHIQDQEQILKLLDRLVQQGNSVIMADNSLLAIKNADWIIEIGPKAGPDGGKPIASGTISDIENNPESMIATYL